MFTDLEPFHHIQAPSKIIILLNQGTTPEPQDTGAIPQPILELMRLCWKILPRQRPHMNDCLAVVRSLSVTDMDSASRVPMEVDQDVGHVVPDASETSVRIDYLRYNGPLVEEVQGRCQVTVTQTDAKVGHWLIMTSIYGPLSEVVKVRVLLFHALRSTLSSHSQLR